ncbi:FecCD family ABC transporter permease [Desulfobacter curvatus]|uniref:FecCD family ABC transporter permease n=1 Tax=Desulfobacter curvatus TaxID=2290 RepID=UPI0012FA165D|nr:iron ABC transporter permease [Desulfobacter curvatus]
MNGDNTKGWWKSLVGPGGLALALAATGLYCIQTGTCQVPFSMIVKTISSHLVHWPDPATISALNHTIIWEIRLPRTLLAMAVGVCLSVSGVVFQGCFRNPLVEPYVLGASSGAAFGAALGIVFPAFFLSVQIMAFVFSALAVAIAYTMARTGPDTPIITLVLSGIITGSVFASLVGLLKYLAQDTALREIVFWLMGGFYYAGWQEVRILFAVAAVGLVIIQIYGWQLNVLSMGEEEAKSLGINPGRTQFILISLATLMTAAAVSATGIIAWVGLMLPHAARLMTGPDHRRVVPVSAILGAIYLIICDTLARTLTTAEIPIGIITSLVGAPYLFYLVRTRGGQVFGR